MHFNYKLVYLVSTIVLCNVILGPVSAEEATPKDPGDWTVEELENENDADNGLYKIIFEPGLPDTEPAPAIDQEDGALEQRDKRAGGGAAAAAIAAPVVEQLTVGLLNQLDESGKSYIENEALVCFWNEWRDRDQRARIEKSFNYGRFSRVKRSFWGWIKNGRWYCCFTQPALKGKGWPLDN